MRHFVWCRASTEAGAVTARLCIDFILCICLRGEFHHVLLCAQHPGSLGVRRHETSGEEITQNTPPALLRQTESTVLQRTSRHDKKCKRTGNFQKCLKLRSNHHPTRRAAAIGCRSSSRNESSRTRQVPGKVLVVTIAADYSVLVIFSRARK